MGKLCRGALEWEHLEQVRERAVEELGGYLDWPIGRVLIVGAPAERSHWVGAEPERFAAFVSASEWLGAEHCEHGLIELAGATRMPHWVTDLGSLEEWRGAD